MQAPMLDALVDSGELQPVPRTFLIPTDICLFHQNWTMQRNLEPDALKQ